jgi:hypothetical protein
MNKLSIVLSLCLLSPAITTAHSLNAPQRASLIDTGYDFCVLSNGKNCASNKNLLFRGDEPLDDENNYTYDPEQFRSLIFNYIQKFQAVYSTKAYLPQTMDELKNYRIVIINLLYDGNNHGTDDEYNELSKEFKYSSAVTTEPLPEQHKIYGLHTVFDPNHFAFQWWPLTLMGAKNPDGIETNLNWPNQESVPVPRSDQFYKRIDFQYLLTGNLHPGDAEPDAIDLITLLMSQPEDGHPLLIFYHCVAGVDRTGFVTLSYFMNYGGYSNLIPQLGYTYLTRNSPLSFKEALKATTNNGYRQPSESAQVSAQSYCLTLGKYAEECER